MLAQDLELYVLRIGEHELGRGLHLHVGGDLVSHHDHSHRRGRRIRNAVLDPDGKVHEVIRLYGNLFIAVQQRPAAFLDEIDLLLRRVTHQRAGPAGRDGQFAITDHSLELVPILVANAEERFIGCRPRGEVVRLRVDVRYLPPQKNRIRGEKATRDGQDNG